ncbi:hypothetical protein [Clostridium sp. JS66]|nr:hypothetical protein [Clostridium sp. JS66]WPC39662.1 hypothetical protein Q6H37_17275 [Clostridium sp. JS66]
MLVNTKIVKRNNDVEFYDMFSMSQVIFDMVKRKRMCLFNER